jgi:hypothetical protein
MVFPSKKGTAVMNRSLPWQSAVSVVLLLAVSTAFACPRLFRGRIAEPAVISPAPPGDAIQKSKPPANADPLAIPDGHVLLLTLRAKGVQVYECKPKKTNAAEFEWAFQAPEATLFDERGDAAGTHGAGPTWQAKDGSKIVADKVADTKSPGGGAIPWLLLKVSGREGKGIFSNVTYVQRVDTMGGLPPVDGATKKNAGKEICIKYEATYRFFGPSPEMIDKAAAAVKEILKKAAFNRDCLPTAEFDSAKLDPSVLILEWDRVREEIATTLMRMSAYNTGPFLELLFTELDKPKLEKLPGTGKINFEKGTRMRMKMLAPEDSIIQEVMKKALEVSDDFFLIAELRTIKFRWPGSESAFDKKYRRDQNLDLAEVEKAMRALIQTDFGRLVDRELRVKESVKDQDNLHVLSDWVPSKTLESKQFKYFWRVGLSVERVKGEQKWSVATHIDIGRKSLGKSEMVDLGGTEKLPISLLLRTALPFKEAEELRNTAIVEVPDYRDTDNQWHSYVPPRSSPLAMSALRVFHEFTIRLTGNPGPDE